MTVFLVLTHYVLSISETGHVEALWEMFDAPKNN